MSPELKILDVVVLSWSQMFNMDHRLKSKEVMVQEIETYILESRSLFLFCLAPFPFPIFFFFI